MTTTVLSIVTSIRDYYEILHKVLETDSAYRVSDYGELGAMITYGIIALKDFFYDLVTFSWLRGIWDLPIIVPEIGSSMISEISVLDGYFHNTFNFLDRPISYGETSIVISSLEKFTIGFINSFFLFLPTSTTHLVTMRRFIVHGLQAGYMSGLGSVAANIFWIASVIFGWRFIVIPWLSFDIFRYFLGFMLLIKYIVDCQNERNSEGEVDSPSPRKVFLFSFVLTLTEQTCIYPFISNLSVGPEGSILESFPAQNYIEFISIHGSYLFGLLAGSLILLHATCWFWENPIYKLYLWAISFGKNREYMDEYYYFTNIVFTYLTFLCAMTSIPYYGLDYTIGGALGYQDRDIAFTGFAETLPTLEMGVFSTDPSGLNTRTNKGRHGRSERWKRRLRQLRAMDVELGEGAEYDFFPLEDLNYGFDRFWTRRKMRNHRSRFRVFPAPLMRAGKMIFAKPRLERGLTERTDFFRLIFEQVYTSTFHQYKLPLKSALGQVERKEFIPSNLASNLVLNNELLTLLPKKNNVLDQRSEKMVRPRGAENGNPTLKYETATLRKLVRKIDQRLKNSEIKKNLKRSSGFKTLEHSSQETLNKGRIYSKRLKKVFSRMAHGKTGSPGSYGAFRGKVRNSSQHFLSGRPPTGAPADDQDVVLMTSVKKEQSHLDLSKADKQILKYREALFNSESNQKPTIKGQFLRPLNFYLEKQNSFERKLRYYTPTLFRTLRAGTNAPHFATSMEGFFYYYKPDIRWERTLRLATNRTRRIKRETPARRVAFPAGLGFSELTKTKLEQTNGSEKQTLLLSPDAAQIEADKWDQSRREQKPTRSYTLSGKRAARYRQQIYKDVLQHWYYSPFNRLLVKFDVDLFIKRQPKSHFLTKNEENLLHLRRFLLFEHYNTLRWYTYMQHYRSMKSKIGGTKSFASGMYNQQFAGTFKKIRHLFAITPSDTLPTVSPLDTSSPPALWGNDGTPFFAEGATGRINPDQDPLISLDDTPSILKYDQPLYNEYRNSSSNSIPKNFIIHEELISDVDAMEKNGLPKDLLNQSTQIIRDYLTRTHDTKRNYIKQLIKDKNYLELTQFIYKGRKTRGSKPALNEARFLEQEKEYLLTDGEKTQLKNLEKIKTQRYLKPLQNDLWFMLIKKWKVNVANRTTLRSFIRKHKFKRKKVLRMRRYQFQDILEHLTKELSVKPLFVRKNQKKSRELKRTNVPRPTLTEEQEMLQTSLVSTPIDNTLVAGASTIRPRGSSWVKMGNKSQEKERFRNTFIWNSDATTDGPEIRRDRIRKFSQMNPNTKMIFVSDLNRSSLVKKQKELVSSVNSLSALLQKIKRKATKLPHHKKYKKYKNNRRGMKVKPLINSLDSKIKTVFNSIKRRLLKTMRPKRMGLKPSVSARKARRKWQRRSILEERARDSRYEMRDEMKNMIPGQRKPRKYVPDSDISEKSDFDDEMERLRRIDANVDGRYYHRNRYVKSLEELDLPEELRKTIQEFIRNANRLQQIDKSTFPEKKSEFRQLLLMKKMAQNIRVRKAWMERIPRLKWKPGEPLYTVKQLRYLRDELNQEMAAAKQIKEKTLKRSRIVREGWRLKYRQQVIMNGPLNGRADIKIRLAELLEKKRQKVDGDIAKIELQKGLNENSEKEMVAFGKRIREEARQARIDKKNEEAKIAEQARTSQPSPSQASTNKPSPSQPSSSQPSPSQPSTNKPSPSQAGPSQPSTNKPSSSQAGPSQPSPSQPSSSQPSPSQPSLRKGFFQASTNKPSTSQASTSQASTSQASTNKPSPSQPSSSQPSTSPSEASTNKPSPSQPSPSEASTNKPSSSQPSPSQPSTNKPGPSQTSPSQPSPSQPGLRKGFFQASTNKPSTSQASTSQASTSQASPSQASTNKPSPSQPSSSQPSTSPSEASTNKPGPSQASTSQASTSQAQTLPTSNLTPAVIKMFTNLYSGTEDWDEIRDAPTEEEMIRRVGLLVEKSRQPGFTWRGKGFFKANSNEPSTSQASTSQASTSQASTSQASTSQASTSKPSLSQPSPSQPSPSQPSTNKPSPSQPSTGQPSTSQIPPIHPSQVSTGQVRILTPEQRAIVSGRLDPEVERRYEEERARREKERKETKQKEHEAIAKKFHDRARPKKEDSEYRPLIEKTWLGRLRIRLRRRFRKTSLKHKAYGRIRKGTPYIKDGVVRRNDFLDVQASAIEAKEDDTNRQFSRLEKMQLFFNRWKELLGTSQELDRKHLFQPIPMEQSAASVRKLRAHMRAFRLTPLFQLRQQYGVKRLPRQRLRAYFKKFSSIQQSMAFRQAWWDRVLPQVRADINVQFQHQQNSLLKRRYDTLSEFEIVKRNNEAIEKKTEKLSLLSPQESRALSSSERRKVEAEKTRNGINKIPLEIGDYDSKPLAIPAAIKLRKKAMFKLSIGSSSGLSKRATRLIKKVKKSRELQYATKEDKMKNIGPFNTEMNITSNPSLPTEVSEISEVSKVSLPNAELPSLSSSGKRKNSITTKRPNDVISQVLEATLLNENKTTPMGNKHGLIPTTSIPFYAGWDESLRKFVVTNRLLTRRDADSELRIRNNYDSRLSKLINLEPELSNITNVQFTSPLRGMAAGTAFAIAVPFGVYATEQFFSVGYDGFAPIGWRRFAFRQTLLKTWLYQRASNKLNSKSRNRRKPRNKVIVRNKTTILNKTKPMKVISKLNYKIDEKVNPLFRATPIFNKKSSDPQIKNKNSRLRSRLVRYSPRIPKAPIVNLMSSLGPRLTDVLPLQYTQIFFVGDRTYDDILLKRHLREDFPANVKLSNPSSRSVPDFTLRQLVNPHRFYHIKSELGHSYDDPYVIPRRLKFLRYKSAPMRWRPIGVPLLEGVSIPDFIKDVRKSRAISRFIASRPIRAASLKEQKEKEDEKHRLPPRASQQIVRNIQRIEGREGGLIWDDDYLRLDQSITNISFEKYALQTKPTPLPNNQSMNVGLAEKLHNYKALKTKLKKARRSNKLRERMKQLRYIL
jgi:hypothetical protein